MEICKICGERLEILTEYHCNKHGFTKDEYRKIHGDNKQSGFRGFSFVKRREFSEIERLAIERSKKCKRKEALKIKNR